MTLDTLCERLGIQTAFFDADTNREIVADKVSKTEICRALGYPADNDKQIAQSLIKWEREQGDFFAPFTKVVSINAVHCFDVDIYVPADQVFSVLSWTLTREDGSTDSGQFKLTDVTDKQIVADKLRYRIGFNLSVPLGYHTLTFLLDGEKPNQPQTKLIVVPEKCYWPPFLTENKKVWGVPVQLYAVRSDHNWGMGDFSDLEKLVLFYKNKGAELVGLNPLNALFIDNPEMASPYAPSSRTFLNPMYIDTDAVPEAHDCLVYQSYKKSDRFNELINYARSSDTVDYAVVSEMKYTALGLLFDAFHKIHLDDQGAPLTARGKEFIDFCAHYGRELTDYATFQVMRQYAQSEKKPVCWKKWDQAYRSPDTAAVRSFQRKYADSILFMKYLQFIAFEQYGHVGTVCLKSGYGIGLYADLPVGVGEDSSEVWAHQNLFLKDLSIGSPPDMFNKKGQNWALAPFNPIELKKTGYALYIQTLESVMQNAGAVRIDHAFGLMRLFLRGKNGKGAYLSYPFMDMMGILALESVRNNCLVVAEDLGTPPPTFYEKMRAFGTLSFRLFWYQRNGFDFVDPCQYEPYCLITTGTHDLPTLAAYVRAADLDLSRAMKIISAAQYKKLKEERPLILSGYQKLCQKYQLSADDIVENVYRLLALSNCVIMLVRPEDVTKQVEQVNLPGTYLEYPNWRFKWNESIEQLPTDERVMRMADLLKQMRGV